MPNAIGHYNKYMGGVDLLDSLTAKYKFPLKARRWYMYIFWHTIALAVINAWLLYKRDCEALKVPQKDILKLRRFQAQLASSLILVRIKFCLPFVILLFQCLQYLRLDAFLTCTLTYSILIR